MAATSASKPVNPALEKNWRDFIHYLRIARLDAALSYGKAIVDSKPDPADLYRLSISTENYLETLQRAEKQAELKDTITAIRQLIEEGYKKVNRDPQQIAGAIKMLSGTLRARTIGQDRLVESGEFAVPQLIAAMEEQQMPVAQKDEIAFVLVKMGLPAVRPLCAALGTPQADVRLSVCQALGKIGYPQAAPYLRRVLALDNIDSVKAAAQTALVAVTGDVARVINPWRSISTSLPKSITRARNRSGPTAATTSPTCGTTRAAWG